MILSKQVDDEQRDRYWPDRELGSDLLCWLLFRCVNKAPFSRITAADLKVFISSSPRLRPCCEAGVSMTSWEIKPLDEWETKRAIWFYYSLHPSMMVQRNSFNWTELWWQHKGKNIANEICCKISDKWRWREIVSWSLVLFTFDQCKDQSMSSTLAAKSALSLTDLNRLNLVML